MLQELAGLGRGGLDALQRAARKALDNQRAMHEAALLQPSEDGREIHLAAPDVHEHFLGREEILHAHPDYQTVHGGGILDRVELAVRVVEDIARVIPQAEVLLGDQIDGFAALWAGGVLAAVRLDAEADAFRGGIVAALGNGLVVELVKFLVGGPG